MSVVKTSLKGIASTMHHDDKSIEGNFLNLFNRELKSRSDRQNAFESTMRLLRKMYHPDAHGCNDMPDLDTSQKVNDSSFVIKMKRKYLENYNLQKRTQQPLYSDVTLGIVPKTSRDGQKTQDVVQVIHFNNDDHGSEVKVEGEVFQCVTAMDFDFVAFEREHWHKVPILTIYYDGGAETKAVEMLEGSIAVQIEMGKYSLLELPLGTQVCKGGGNPSRPGEEICPRIGRNEAALFADHGSAYLCRASPNRKADEGKMDKQR